jgi:hypothetical protein
MCSTAGLKVVPMYDIDLMWHTHMAHSGVYRTDMQAFNEGKVGRIMASINDRSCQLDGQLATPADELLGGAELPIIAMTAPSQVGNPSMKNTFMPSLVNCIPACCRS